MRGRGASSCPRSFRLRAVLFDFDGTLTRPGALDFAALKREVGCPTDRLGLEWIEALPAGAQRTAALSALERFELAGAAESEANEGAEDLVRRLQTLGLKVAVLTRNGRLAVERALGRFSHLGADDFDVLITRDDDVAPKPSPDGVSRAAMAMGVTAGETLVVGDFLLDMQAGRAAGAVTAYLTNGAGSAAVDGASCPDGVGCDFVVQSLAELDGVVALGLPMPQGKLPNEHLSRHLKNLAGGDPAVLLPAAVGEDVSALDMTGVEVLVAHGDPITLAGSELGRYAVLVNANDIAASGGDPRWLLTTVLLPTGTTPSQALALLDDISATAEAENIVLIGGHTEVSAVVNRPVVSATMLGVVRRADLRDKREALPRDKVILTKRLAAEGTALLARERGERLRDLGMTASELNDCRSLLDRLSIVPEARIATRFAGVRALHDVTEGGLATAVRELAEACRHGITVHLERIPAFPQTTRVCEVLGADPLGLIASGSLLICCRPSEAGAVVAALHDALIEAVEIGEVGAPGAGVTALERGRPAPWPEFTVDEAARVLGQS